MPTPDHLRLRVEDPNNLLWPFVGLLQKHLEQGRYHETRRRKYVATMLHFGSWLRTHGLAVEHINERRIVGLSQIFVVNELLTIGEEIAAPQCRGANK